MQLAKVIGVGAAGNKAAIALIEKGVIDHQRVLLLNTTMKDIPEKYRDYAIEFGDYGGCGKDRELGKKMILGSLHNGKVLLDSFMAPEDTMCIIVTSSEGGTGSGASIILAEYMHDMDVVVHLFVFTGFEDDVHSLKNTVEWFQNLSPDYVVEAVSNKKFLKENDNNRDKAEKAANEEFANRIGILLGNEIVESEHNMDDTDIYKLTTTPGFMTIETCHLTKLKDQEEFNALMQAMIDDTKSLTTEQSAMRIGVVINATAKTCAAIDMSFQVLKNAYGTPMDLFKHKQNVHDDEYINVICAGMKLPLDEIKATYEKYKKQVAMIDKANDSFFDRTMDTSDSDDIGSRLHSRNAKDPTQMQKAKNNFFSKYGLSQPKSAEPVKKESKFVNTAQNEV